MARDKSGVGLLQSAVHVVHFQNMLSDILHAELLLVYSLCMAQFTNLLT
jgi:hypothetical protein